MSNTCTQVHKLGQHAVLEVDCGLDLDIILDVHISLLFTHFLGSCM